MFLDVIICLKDGGWSSAVIPVGTLILSHSTWGTSACVSAESHFFSVGTTRPSNIAGTQGLPFRTTGLRLNRDPPIRRVGLSCQGWVSGEMLNPHKIANCFVLFVCFERETAQVG